MALPQVSKISTYLMLCNFTDMVFWALAREWKFGSYLSQGHSNAYFFPCICKPTLPRRESKNSRLANTNFLSYLQLHLLYSASLIFGGREKKTKKKTSDVDKIYTISKSMESLPPIFSLDSSVFNFVKGYVNFNTC